jgi:WD40 repeat protein
MDSRPADGSKSVPSAKRWFKARNGTLTVVRIQRTYTRRAAKRSFKSGQTMIQVTGVTGREVFTLSGHASEVLSVAWSPDAKRLASSSADGIVQVYAMDIGLLMAVTRHAQPEAGGVPQIPHLDEVPPIPFVSSGDAQ